MTMQDYCKSILPQLLEMWRDLPREGVKSTFGKHLRKTINAAVRHKLGIEAGAGDLLRDVEFRYSPYSARVDSDMEEGVRE